MCPVFEFDKPIKDGNINVINNVFNGETNKNTKLNLHLNLNLESCHSWLLARAMNGAALVSNWDNRLGIQLNLTNKSGVLD